MNESNLDTQWCEDDVGRSSSGSSKVMVGRRDVGQPDGAEVRQDAQTWEMDS